MSTNINITVGDDALLNRVKQQQSANRQAQLEREASARLEAQATVARTSTLTAAGKDAAGNPLIGTPSKAPQLQQRPAANRFGGNGFVLVPSAGPTPFGFEAKTRGIRNTTFTKLFATSTGGYTAYDIPDYVAAGGPGNASYLRAQLRSPGDTYFNSLDYLVCDTPGVQGVRFPTSFSSDPFRVLTADGEVIAQQIQKPIHKLTSYTVELYMQAPPEGPLTVPGTTIECSATTDLFVRSQPAITRLALISLDLDSNFPNKFNATVVGAGNSTLGFVYFGYQPLSPPPNSYIWPTPLQFGNWYHFAYVRTGNLESFYFEGTLVFSRISNLSFLLNIPDTFLTVSGFKFFYGEFTTTGNALLRPAIHGYRFTPRAVYTDNFVPPAQITKLT